MTPDSLHRYYVYVVLLALICLLTLLHTIKLVDIPTHKFMQGLNRLCRFPAQKQAWSGYTERTGYAPETANTDRRYNPGSYLKSAITNPKSGGKDANYDSFTEVLSDKYTYSKNTKESELIPQVSDMNDYNIKINRTIGKIEESIENPYSKLRPLRFRRYGNEWLMTKDELLFLRAWCIQRDFRVNWDRVLGQCKDHTTWSSTKPYWKKSTATAARHSKIVDVEIRPVGQFSRFFIQSGSEDGTRKTSGGDSWRVHVKEAASVPVTVVDHNNGLYEALFLLTEPGQYSVEVILDYTLCDGMKDPTSDWFRKGNAQGKYQHPETLPGYERPYLLQPLVGGINFTASPAQLSVLQEMHENGLLQKYCPNPSCLVWDGFGRWVQNVWTPYAQDKAERDPTDHRDGFFWIYGDSVADLFYKSVSKRVLCKELFAGCEHTYNWVYKLKDNNITQAKMQWDSDDFSVDRVISELDNVISDSRMNDHSVIMINMGLHYVQGITFTTYKRLIQRTIDLFTSHMNSPHGYHGKVIWKTTTALFKERYGDPKTAARHAKGLRFLTVPRVQLFNAYATSIMCRNGIDVLDVYPISDSYPAGTGGVSRQWDAVHFKADCFSAVEDTLEEYLG